MDWGKQIHVRLARIGRKNALLKLIINGPEPKQAGIKFGLDSLVIEILEGMAEIEQTLFGG